MITIIDYGIGNLGSIKNMLKKAGVKSRISSTEEEIADAEKLILPGVGAFDYGMSQLTAATYYETLNKRVLEDKIPVLGICLGAQLLTEGSEEGELSGLGWIKGKTIKFREEKMDNSLKVPHMGWNEVETQKDSKLFEDMFEEPRFYFVHTYHIKCEEEKDVLVRSTYGYNFIAGVENENVLGVQFHPEKSHKFGLKLLTNFANNY
ncbi:MAG: imidazole glycerol phosphate synthase subunit HisH [Bacteroidota bacterium]